MTSSGRAPLPTAASDLVVDLLSALVAEVRGLRADLAAHRDQRAATASLSRNDRTLLARVLPAIGGALGSEAFLARDLFEHAALRLVLRGLSTRQLGRLLRRAAVQAIDGYLVERAGVELNATLWRVVAVVPDFLGNEKVSTPPPAKCAVVK